MDEYTACEQAYKNGYEQGKKDAVKYGKWLYNYGSPYTAPGLKEQLIEGMNTPLSECVSEEKVNLTKQHRFEYAIGRWHGVTLFKVLRMPEEWRGKDKIFTTSNRFSIRSVAMPAIYCDSFAIYLCGKFTASDNIVVVRQCSRSQHRRIVAALKELQEWADNAMVDELNQKIDGGLNQG